ncbi:MAG: helix-turn-helix transcriptional regulator [Candidatus Sericytochromatia bacterium]|nr:helix-turn-helix transcriptional regulator [Candidatus Sericytochromatia bacterium]
MRSFDEGLVAAMQAKGLDYRTLGKLVGVSHAHLWQLVRASREALQTGTPPVRKPTPDLLAKLAATLEISLTDLGSPSAPSDAEPGKVMPPIIEHAPLRPAAPRQFQDGLAALQQGQVDRALLLLRQAARQQEVSLALAEAGLGIAYYKAGRYAEAVRSLTAALAEVSLAEPSKELPKRADLLYDRGLAYQDLGRHDAAAKDFRAALSAGLSQPERAIAGWCFSALAQGHWRAVVHEVLSWTGRPEAEHVRSTSSLDLRAYGAYAMIRLGQHAGALAVLDALVLLCPTYWYSLYVRAAARARAIAGRDASGTLARRLADGALGDARRAIALNPGARDILRRDQDLDFVSLHERPEWQGLLAGAEESPL